MIVVSDTSPIRGLISVGKLDLLEKLFGQIIIPKAVEEELLRIKKVKTNISSELNKEWIIIRSVKSGDALNELEKHLDSGESEAIVLAKEIDCALILMDENKGRTISKSMGLDVLGLIGILIAGKKKGYIENVKPLLDDLRENFGFWINEAFYFKILKEIDE